MASGIETPIGERIRRLRALRLRPAFESKPKAPVRMKITLVCSWCRNEIVQLVTRPVSSRGGSEPQEMVFDGVCADCRGKHVSGFGEASYTPQKGEA